MAASDRGEWACSSTVERSSYTRLVPGSNPGARKGHSGRRVHDWFQVRILADRQVRRGMAGRYTTGCRFESIRTDFEILYPLTPPLARGGVDRIFLLSDSSDDSTISVL